MDSILNSCDRTQVRSPIVIDRSNIMKKEQSSKDMVFTVPASEQNNMPTGEELEMFKEWFSKRWHAPVCAKEAMNRLASYREWRAKRETALRGT